MGQKPNVSFRWMENSWKIENFTPCPQSIRLFYFCQHIYCFWCSKIIMKHLSRRKLQFFFQTVVSELMLLKGLKLSTKHFVNCQLYITKNCSQVNISIMQQNNWHFGFQEKQCWGMEFWQYGNSSSPFCTKGSFHNHTKT